MAIEVKPERAEWDRSLRRIWLDEANLLHALNDRRMEHIAHPRSHIGVRSERKVRVVRIQEIVGRIIGGGDRLVLLADPDALRGLHPFRAFHIHDFTHRCLLPGRGTLPEKPEGSHAGVREGGSSLIDLEYNESIAYARVFRLLFVSTHMARADASSCAISGNLCRPRSCISTVGLQTGAGDHLASLETNSRDAQALSSAVATLPLKD
jgi:hypothetical protein